MHKYRLMVPGPTPIPPEILAAGALPIVDERTPEFATMFRQVTENLQRIFLTENDVFMYTASGTGALEGAIQNLFSPGDRVLVVNNGFFGSRWVELCQAFGLKVTELTYQWGQKADNNEIAEMLVADPQLKAAICVLSETSTGTVNDVRGFGQAAQSAISVIDAVSGLGACELRTDEWGLDVVITASQKALMLPPGLGFVSVSERAWQAHQTARLPRYYFDWTAASKAYDQELSRTPWTPAIQLIVQLDIALRRIIDEGLENVFRRHMLLGRATREGIKGMGLNLFGPDDDTSAAVTAAWVPDGIDGKQLVRLLLLDYGIQVANGQGTMEGKMFRIGHCGYFDALDIVSTIAATELVLESLGYSIELGTGVSATQRVFSKGRVTL